MRRLISAVLGLAIIAVLTLVYALHWRPNVETYPVQGIDVSHHNGDIVWPTVAADGVDFAYIKATEGADMHDPRFAEHWIAADKAGVRRGAYHFFTLCRSATDQATNFIANVPRDAKALSAAVDLEFGGNCTGRPARNALLAELKIFITMVEAHTDKPIILYLTQEFDAFYDISSAINRQLWLRSIILKPAYGARPWVMWQASSFNRVHGIQGRVDWNVVKP